MLVSASSCLIWTFSSGPRGFEQKSALDHKSSVVSVIDSFSRNLVNLSVLICCLVGMWEPSVELAIQVSKRLHPTLYPL
jgi:hypothetical protein